MNRICFSAFSKLRYLSVNSCKSTPTLLHKVKFNNIKLYCATSVTGDNANPSDTSDESPEETKPNNNNEDTQKPTKPEGISERLKRLSEQSPEEYVPTLDFEAAEAQRWERYSNKFPDQRLRSLNPNPRQGGSFRPSSGGGFGQNRYDGGYNADRYQDQGGYGQNRYQGQGGYGQNRYQGQGGYSQNRYDDGGYRNNRYDNDRNNSANRYRSLRDEDVDDEDESVRYRPPRRYESSGSSGRQQNRFDDEDDNEDFDDEPDSSPRYPSNTRQYNGRFEDGYKSKSSFGQRQSQSPRKFPGSNRAEFDGDDDMQQPKAIDYKKMQQEYDLDDSDLPVEPRQSSSIRFANSENRQAIKEAYLKRFQNIDATGSKREFHSYAPGVSSKSFVPEFKDLTNLKPENSSDRPARKSNLKRQPKRNDDIGESMKNNIESDDVFERDVLFNKNDDPDVFGTLASGNHSRRVDIEDPSAQEPIDSFSKNVNTIYEEEEEDDQVYRPEVRMSMKKLTFQTKELFAVGKITEALDLFTNTMKEGGFRYDLHELEYLYRIVICEIAKQGHIKMAFKLYTQMVKRGLKVAPGVYTSLFNACAQSPWAAEDNIKRMNRLRDYMERKGILPNLVNYNAMIKAYGRCGDTETAFALVDEMIERRERDLRPDVDTFCFLLQTCVSDKENGFRHALLTWSKMKSMRIRPKIYNYNLLLRAARECSVALPEDIQKQIDNRQQRLLEIKCSTWDPIELKKYSLENASVIDDLYLISDSTDAQHVEALNSMESLLPAPLSSNASDRRGGKVVLNNNQLDALRRLSDLDFRLKMLGGYQGILNEMKKDRIYPDLKTMQELIILVSHAEVLDVLKLTESFRLKPDVCFYNIIIRKLSIMGKGHEARDIIKSMNKNHLSPDSYTWTALAMGCYSWLDAKALMADMAASNFSPTIDLLGCFLSIACKRCDPLYVQHIMRHTVKLGIIPSGEFLDHIDQFRKNVKKGIVQAEKGELVTVPHLRVHLKNDPELFRANWKKFQLNYDGWVKKSEVNIEPADPWAEDYASRSKYAKNKKTQEENEQ